MDGARKEEPKEDSWLRLFRELYDPRSETRIREEDEHFGRKLVSLGLVTEEQLREGFELQERLASPGSPSPRIATVLIENGALSKDRLARTLVERVAADPSHRLGPFVLFEPLGRLRAAETWRAWDGRRRGWVRLACLKPGHPEAGRFLREAGVLLRLEHPNLVRALDGGEADGRAYVAFEWLKAETMAAARPAGEALAAAVRDAARGVQAAHEAGLAHGALEPAHVLLAEGGAKVLLVGGVSSVPEADLRALLSMLGEDRAGVRTAGELAAALDRP